MVENLNSQSSRVLTSLKVVAKQTPPEEKQQKIRGKFKFYSILLEVHYGRLLIDGPIYLYLGIDTLAYQCSRVTHHNLVSTWTVKI